MIGQIKKILIYFLLLFSFPVALFAQFDINTILPKHIKNTKLLKYSGYQVAFDTIQCLPVYSAYILTRNHLEHPIIDRSKFKFLNDPSVPGAHVEYYKHSGYDRGHLTPAADMKYSLNSMQDCFYVTNLCPQLHCFNAGIWENLEKKFRSWAYDYDSLIVVSGPVLSSCKKKGFLNIPGKFYKIVYSIKSKKRIAFLIDSNLNQGLIFEYEISIKHLNFILNANYFKSITSTITTDTIDNSYWK